MPFAKAHEVNKYAKQVSSLGTCILSKVILIIGKVLKTLVRETSAQAHKDCLMVGLTYGVFHL